MKKITSLKYRKNLIIQRPQFQSFEVISHLNPSDFNAIKSVWLEFGCYTVGNRVIVALA